MRWISPANSVGIPLVALHGFWGQATDWARLSSEFQETFSVWAPELPGHGPGAHSDEPFTWPALRLAFQSWASACLPERYGLLGYSMGGRIALDLVCSGALKPQALILESCRLPLPADEIPLRLQHDAVWAKRLREESTDRVLQDWLAQPLFASLHHHPEVISRLLADRQNANPNLLARSLAAFGLGTQPQYLTTPFSAPVLALTGEFDHKFSQLAPALCDFFPLARHQVVAGAGHNTHAEKPQAFADAVATFLTPLF